MGKTEKEEVMVEKYYGKTFSLRVKPMEGDTTFVKETEYNDMRANRDAAETHIDDLKTTIAELEEEDHLVTELQAKNEELCIALGQATEDCKQYKEMEAAQIKCMGALNAENTLRMEENKKLKKIIEERSALDMDKHLEGTCAKTIAVCWYCYYDFKRKEKGK